MSPAAADVRVDNVTSESVTISFLPAATDGPGSGVDRYVIVARRGAPPPCPRRATGAAPAGAGMLELRAWDESRRAALRLAGGTPGVAYGIRVCAVDAADNAGAPGAAVRATTKPLA